jgi:hypothetical protein
MRMSLRWTGVLERVVLLSATDPHRSIWRVAGKQTFACFCRVF